VFPLLAKIQGSVFLCCQGLSVLTVTETKTTNYDHTFIRVTYFQTISVMKSDLGCSHQTSYFMSNLRESLEQNKPELSEPKPTQCSYYTMLITSSLRGEKWGLEPTFCPA